MVGTRPRLVPFFPPSPIAEFPPISRHNFPIALAPVFAVYLSVCLAGWLAAGRSSALPVLLEALSYFRPQSPFSHFILQHFKLIFKQLPVQVLHGGYIN